MYAHFALDGSDGAFSTASNGAKSGFEKGRSQPNLKISRKRAILKNSEWLKLSMHFNLFARANDELFAENATQNTAQQTAAALLWLLLLLLAAAHQTAEYGTDQVAHAAA
jgi:hypothetical protein